MSIGRQSREEKKIRAHRRAEFRCKQRMEYIDWEFDHLEPEIAELLGQVKAIEPPSNMGFEVEYIPPTAKPRRAKAKSKKA